MISFNLCRESLLDVFSKSLISLKGSTEEDFNKINRLDNSNGFSAVCVFLGKRSFALTDSFNDLGMINPR